MDLEKFLNTYSESLKNGIVTEACVGDFFDLVLEMGVSEKRAIISQLRRLYTHMLKYLYQPDHQTRSWINTIRDSHNELKDYSTVSKNIWRSITDDDIIRCYNNAIISASNETGIDKRKFSKEMGVDFEIDNIIDTEYIENFLKTYAYSYEAKKVLYLV